MTEDERNYFESLVQMGCIACRQMGIQSDMVEIHHVRYMAGMGQRAPNIGGTIPLCYEHHRGNLGIHTSKKRFEELYGTERELHQQVLEKLK